MEKIQPLYQLQVFCCDTRGEMGRFAAAQAAETISRVLSRKPYARMICAAAPSQNECLAGLAASGVDFSRIIAFHMDEYVGLSGDDPASFQSYLRKHIFEQVPFAQVHYINGAAADIEAECRHLRSIVQQITAS